MVSTARLFMLLVIAIPIPAILAVSDVVPELLQSESTLNDNYLDVLHKGSDISDSCPPFGQPDNRTSVTVMDITSRAISGYASMVPPNHEIPPSFNLWLPRLRTGGGRLREKNMSHYLFECLERNLFSTDENPDEWHVMLYDQDARWAGYPNYILCALYEMVNEDPPIIKMVISANASCAGLWQRMNQSEHTVPEGLRRFADGSVAHHFSKSSPQTPVWRKKRSEVQGGGCRFPDWSQGSWTDLKIDGNMLRYEPVFHEKDHVDYGQENDDGKDTGAETGGEQYIQRSQRHAPIGKSGIDHSSSHDSRSHRNRRFIPYFNTVKMFRTQTSTIQNNTLDKAQLRKTKNLGNKHDDREKETNNEKKRCYCYTDFEVFTPKNDRFTQKIVDGMITFIAKTQKYPEDLKEKSNFSFDFVEFQKKRQLGNQNHHFKVDTKLQQNKNYISGDMHILNLLKDKNTFSTEKEIMNLNEKMSPLDLVQRKKKTVKHSINYGEEEIYNKKKRCYCYNNFDGFLPKNEKFTQKLIDEMITFLAKNQKYPEDLKEKSNFPFDFQQNRKGSGNQNDHGTGGIKHRQKRSWWCPITKTTTERYIENLKTGDPTEPSFKPQLEFGTTKDPSLPNRKTRSIIEDVDTVNNEEEALKKIKIIDQVNRRIRWWNIVRAIESIRLHALQQSDGNIKYEEYEVFPDNTQIPDSVRYFKDAETRGISYKQSLLNWRSLERAHRQRLAEVAYTAFPGQNHPDVVMRDFDQTFDGIEYDFNPMYPEGTVDDPTAYRALTLPDGYRIEPRLSRRTTFEQKQSRDSSESTTVITSHSEVVPSNTLNERIDQGNTLGLNQRMRRSSAHQNQQQQATTTFTWRCEMTVDDDEKQLPQLENGAKFLTYGGHVVDNNDMTENDQHNEQDSNMSYGCLWLVPRGPNVLEFSVIGTGMPSKNQSMQTFARQLCSENRGNDKDTSVQNDKKLRPHQPRWITETRTNDKNLVQVRCPVPPGIVFYGVVPAPPPNSTVSTNKDQISPKRLCAKLVSSADDCTTGQMGPVDQMKYTVSECVEQDSITGTSQTMVTQQTIYEASRGYTIGGRWQRNKRYSAPIDTSTIASSVATLSTSSNMPNLPLSSHNPSIGTIDNITDHQTTGTTATISIPITPSSTISSRTGINPFVDITTIDPTNFTPTTSSTLLAATPSILPMSSPQQMTSPERQLPSLSKSSTTTISPSTSTTIITTSSSYHLVTDYPYRQQQQWQQQHQQPNKNYNDYYYRGRQQHYPPPPPGSTSMDNNYYYNQQQQQQQHPQTQPHWFSQQHPVAPNDHNNGYQHQTTDRGGHRIADYYYHQQQPNYYNHKHNNDRQQQIPQPQRNSSLTFQLPNGGNWNVRGDRPLYISSGVGDDNNRDASVSWNSSTSISSSNNGGWTTAAQQHWWYQQQQQQQQHQQQQKQLQQQQQQQQRQQQNNRGLGGILSLPPVPLPPLHAEQGAVTISIPTSQPLHPRRQQKPPNHYYLPTLTTKTSSQPYQLRSKSESRYYQEKEYQCLGQWTEPQEHISPVAGEKPVMLTYTYLKRLSPVSKEGSQYECYVGTPIPNDEGLNPETTITILFTEAGTNTKCSRLSDPYRSGMKLVGTKIKKDGACKGSTQPVQDGTTGGSWYSLKPQPISIPVAENGGGAWFAAPPVPVVAQGPTTMLPIITGRHTGANGATFISRQNEQARRPQSANLPSKTNYSIRIVADKRIVILAVILFTGCGFFNKII